jgi:cathepsin D
MLIFDHFIACSTEVQVSLSFGGNTWPISAADMNNGIAGDNPEQCVGSIFDLGQVSSAGSMGGNPDWIIGDTFLVRNHALG